MSYSHMNENQNHIFLYMLDGLHVFSGTYQCKFYSTGRGGSGSITMRLLMIADASLYARP